MEMYVSYTSLKETFSHIIFLSEHIGGRFFVMSCALRKFLKIWKEFVELCLLKREVDLSEFLYNGRHVELTCGTHTETWWSEECRFLLKLNGFIITDFLNSLSEANKDGCLFWTLFLNFEDNLHFQVFIDNASCLTSMRLSVDHSTKR